MAYFGRKPKKPGSVPGSQSGDTRQDRAVRRFLGVTERVVEAGRPLRPGRASKTVRAARSGRSAR